MEQEEVSIDPNHSADLNSAINLNQSESEVPQ